MLMSHPVEVLRS